MRAWLAADLVLLFTATRQVCSSETSPTGSEAVCSADPSPPQEVAQAVEAAACPLPPVFPEKATYEGNYAAEPTTSAESSSALDHESIPFTEHQQQPYPTETLPQPPKQHFPSFNEWKDQHDVHQSIRDRLARASLSGLRTSTATALPSDHSNAAMPTWSVSHVTDLPGAAAISPSAGDAPHTPAHNDTVASAMDRPVSYIHPLPFGGSGQPEDPLLPLSARTNYASFDCSAAVLQSSKQSKGASSILNGSKDKYMLTPCEAEQNFVIVELCEEIDVDALVLANWEFFSSMFKHFSVSGSEVYPGRPEDWLLLGHFRAGNVRAPQVFRPPSLRRFVRYLRVDFLSHYGAEHFCPVSLLRVYGRNHLEAFRDEEAERMSQQLLEQQLVEQQQAALEDVMVQAEVVSSSPSEPKKEAEQTHTVKSEEAAQTSFAGATSDQAASNTSSTELPELSIPPNAAEKPTPSDPQSSNSTTSTPTQTQKQALPSESDDREPSKLSRHANTTAPVQTPIHTPRPAPPQQPTHYAGGESIYGAITKRLTALERDAGLTLNYIEEQSRLVQDMFAALDERLLETERSSTRTDQILRRLMLDQELHRAQIESERTALASQVNTLAEEIVRSKRLGLAQLLGILLILGFVALTRGSSPLVTAMQQHARKPALVPTSPVSTSTVADQSRQSISFSQQTPASRPSKSSPASKKVERDRLPNPRVTPLQRIPSRRNGARTTGAPRSAMTLGESDRGRNSRSSAPAKLFRSQTPPPRFATAGDPSSPANRQPLRPTSQQQLNLHHQRSRPLKLNAESLQIRNAEIPSLGQPRNQLLQSPSAASDRWTSTSGDDLSSDSESDAPAVRQPPRMYAQEGPRTPMG